MRAAVFNRYGEVVRIAEVPQPTPRANEVLVRVKTVAVTSADSRIRRAWFPKGFGLFARLAVGLVRPRRKILGSSFSGEVETVGARVEGLAPGDEVCGMTGARLGAHAEYVVVAAKRLARKPPEVSHEDATGLMFGGTSALFFLRDKAAVGPGKSVLINGASGAVGTNAVQLAKHLGATVTGVTSQANAGLVAELGADRVIDYTRNTLTGRYDVVLDVVGNLSIRSGRSLLTGRGLLLLAVASLTETIRAGGHGGSAPERKEDFEFLLRLAADGKIITVIDQVYDFADIAEAHSRVDSRHKVGNVIVRLTPR